MAILSEEFTAYRELPRCCAVSSYSTTSYIISSMKRDRVKPRGYPDRRGMGAQSDFIAEQFVPDKNYKARQMEMAQRLIAAGTTPEQLEKIFFVPLDLISEEKPEDDKPKNP
jgi:hypothetical protein